MRRKWVPLLGILAIAFFAFALRHTFDRLDENAFDGEVASRAHPHPSWPADLVFIAIDDASISRYSADGQWPVHRREATRVFDRLHELGAKTIFWDGTIITHSDPQSDADLLRALPNVILAIMYSKTDAGDAEIKRRAELPLAVKGVPVFRPEQFRAPIEPFASATRALGHVIAHYEPDGRQRRFAPVIVVGTSGLALPSAPLVALAMQRGIDLRGTTSTADSLNVPGLPPLPLDEGWLRLEMVSAVEAARPRITMIDLLEPKDPEALRQQIAGKLAVVLMENKSDATQSALGVETYGGQILGNVVRQLAAGHGSRRLPPGWILIGIGALLGLATPSLITRAPRSVAGGAVGMMLLYAVVQMQLARRDLFAPLLLPQLQIAASAILLAVHATWHASERADWHRAPTGVVAIVFTDVQGSTRLWEQDRNAMQRALALHNACFRALLSDLGGYEVKTEGDAFMIAFPDVVSAAAWCLTVQATLLALDWPAEILKQPDGAEVTNANGDLLYRGLRVRMGIHLGDAQPQVDPLTGRMDYFGPVVNKAARVSGEAKGGQILVSGEAWSILAAKRGLLPPIDVRDLGMRALKGIAAETQLVEIVPAALAGRESAAA